MSSDVTLSAYITAALLEMNASANVSDVTKTPSSDLKVLKGQRRRSSVVPLLTSTAYPWHYAPSLLYNLKFQLLLTTSHVEKSSVISDSEESTARGIMTDCYDYYYYFLFFFLKYVLYILLRPPVMLRVKLTQEHHCVCVCVCMIYICIYIYIHGNMCVYIFMYI